ncbi:hypothetical protein MTR67_036187 [Solanum verrucosum]|uniref:Uncharacterized protein n=1 Tax=Solanum verrucosum TaxID=315347 RepID=A0AAF0UB91_SOLVR|nr:hypothetical protein MTR67_036187 [Solanum verrucosum]
MMGSKEGSVMVKNSNVFAALDTLRKKKKSDKEKSKGSSKKEQEPEVLWAPAPLTVKSWADVGDEDDDDYYATTAPLQSFVGSNESEKKPEPVEVILSISVVAGNLLLVGGDRYPVELFELRES